MNRSAAAAPPLVQRRRGEYLLYAAFLAAHAYFAPAWAPTYPDKIRAMYLTCGLLSLLAIAKFCWPSLLSPPPHGKRRNSLLSVPTGLVVLFLVVERALQGIVATNFVSPPLAIAMIGIEATALVVLLGSLVTRQPQAGGIRSIATLILFANSLVYFSVCTWLWSPPTESECDTPLRPGIVDRLTPATFSQELSYPYGFFYAEGERRLFATFKMAGNLSLPFWDDHAANRLVSLDLAEDRAPKLNILMLHGPFAPEWLVYDSQHRDLFVTLLANEGCRLNAIRVEPDGRLTLRQTLTVHCEPNGIALSPDDGSLMVFGDGGRDGLSLFDPRSLRELSRQPLAYDMLLSLHHPRDWPFAYFSGLFANLSEVDLRSGKIRVADFSGMVGEPPGLGPWSNIPPGHRGAGFGDVSAAPEIHTVFETDAVRRALNVVDIPSMKLRQRRPLPFGPRPVQADPRRNLVAVGEWIAGRVHFYRLPDLSPIASPVDVGPYLRKFAYDYDRGLLFAASKCGVYQVRVDEIVHEVSAAGAAPPKDPSAPRRQLPDRSS